MSRNHTLRVLLFAGAGLLSCVPMSEPEEFEQPPGPSAIEQVNACVLPGPPVPNTVGYTLDLPYDAPGGVPITLDLAWPTAPAPARSRPLVLFVHGGAWREGSPHHHIEDALRLAGRGYIVASTGYRLVPQVRFPVPIGDVSCALRFLRLASLDLGGDTTRVVVIGHSAGAHIAALVGLNPEANYDAACPYRALAGNRVSGIVGMAGAYDLTRSEDFSVTTRGEITNLLGGTAESRPEVAMAASPVFQVSTADPAVLLVHGTIDDVTPLKQSRQLFTTLRRSNVPSTLLEMKGVWHDLAALDTAVSRRSSSCTVWSFIQKQLGTPGS